MAERTSRTTLSAIASNSLYAELRRREHGVKRLQKRRAKLLRQLGDLETQLAAYGGRRGHRARNKRSLVDVLAQVLKGKTMGVPDAADAVLATGYQSSAGNFRLIVNQTLIKNSDRFKKVSRGQYTGK